LRDQLAEANECGDACAATDCTRDGRGGEIDNFSFSPATLEIKAGTTVT